MKLASMSLSVLCILFSFGAFAAGRIAHIPLHDQSKSGATTMCTYTAILDMGPVADLNPIHVFTLFQGRYQLLSNQPALTPATNGRVSMRVSAFKEAPENAVCPSTSEILIVK